MNKELRSSEVVDTQAESEQGPGNAAQNQAVPRIESQATVALDADYAPCPDPRCNDHLGAMPIPQCVTAVAWAEEAAKVAEALRSVLNIIEADDLISESVSYMQLAREVMKGWPEIPNMPVPPFPITQPTVSASALSTTVPDHGPTSSPESFESIQHEAVVAMDEITNDVVKGKE